MKELNEGLVDSYVLYSFLRKITTPFNQWKAFKLGIIDAQGHILKKRNTLKTFEEKNAFTVFDLLVCNLKKLIEKIPGGKTKLATYLVGLFLIKEKNNYIQYTDEKVLYESFARFYKENKKDLKESIEQLDLKIEKLEDEEEEVIEDVAANSVAGGGIAGTHGDSIVRIKPTIEKRKKLKHFTKS